MIGNIVILVLSAFVAGAIFGVVMASVTGR